jgi:hypothetical protein
MDCCCAHTPTVLGGTRLCRRGWIKLPLKFRACTRSLATSRTLSRRSRTGLMASPARTESWRVCVAHRPCCQEEEDSCASPLAPPRGSSSSLCIWTQKTSASASAAESESAAVDGLGEEEATCSTPPHPSSECGCVHSLRQIFRWGSEYERGSLEADEDAVAEGDEPAEIHAAADDESGKYDPDGRAPSSSRTRSRRNALPSRHIAATMRLLLGLTHVTGSPSVFGIDVDPTCPGRCLAASAPRAALPQRAIAWLRPKLPRRPGWSAARVAGQSAPGRRPHVCSRADAVVPRRTGWPVEPECGGRRGRGQCTTDSGWKVGGIIQTSHWKPCQAAAAAVPAGCELAAG